MSCEKFSDSIGALIDGTIGPEARRALEEHLQSCAACRTLAADLRRIHEETAHLPRVQPPEYLWMKVRGRLEAQIQTEAQIAGLPSTPLRPGKTRATPATWIGALLAGPKTVLAGLKTRPTPVFRAAAFASVVVLVLAVATTYVLLRQPASQPVAQPATGSQAGATMQAAPGSAAAGNASDKEFVQSVEMELTLAEQHYEKAIAGLEQIAKSEQGSLDPQVAAVLQKNLGIIDQAIRESRVALQSQPTNQVAQATLFEAFRRKVALLQDTITLINEMRKGDQAGAARVLQNLNKG